MMKQQLRSCALALALGAFSAIAQASGTLTVCTESAPDGFDIAQSQSSVTHSAVGKTIYDQLLSYKRGTTELVPGLAERWEISADGLQYTLHLRRGVKFHRTPWFTPTRDMNADDVVFSIRRFSDPPWQAAAKNGFGMWIGAGLAEEVKAIDKLDDQTVRFTLRRPWAPFLGSLAWSFTSSVFSAEYAAELMQADWARIGVKTRIQMMEWGELLKRTGQGEHDITFFGWVGAGDPDEFFNINLTCAGIAGGGNGSMWCNKDFDALLEQARAISDRSQRVELYRRAQRWVFDEVPLIPTVYPRVFTALHESVRGFIGSPFADLDFRNVSVLESPK